MNTRQTCGKEQYFTKQALRERGWSEQLIRDLLPRPIIRKNPYYSSKNMYL